jgi:NAD-dependent DNA ligase
MYLETAYMEFNACLQEDFLSLDKVGEKTAAAMLAAIRKAQGLPLGKFLTGLGIR